MIFEKYVKNLKCHTLNDFLSSCDDSIWDLHRISGGSFRKICFLFFIGLTVTRFFHHFPSLLSVISFHQYFSTIIFPNVFFCIFPNDTTHSKNLTTFPWSFFMIFIIIYDNDFPSLMSNDTIFLDYTFPIWFPINNKKICPNCITFFL